MDLVMYSLGTKSCNSLPKTERRSWKIFTVGLTSFRVFSLPSHMAQLKCQKLCHNTVKIVVKDDLCGKKKKKTTKTLPLSIFIQRMAAKADSSVRQHSVTHDLPSMFHKHLHCLRFFSKQSE